MTSVGALLCCETERVAKHMLIILSTLLLFGPLRLADAQTSSGCDIALDTACPWRIDGTCDADGLICPSRNSDCVDCDPCQQYSGDCGNCVDADCAYCDGRCMHVDYIGDASVITSGLCSGNVWNRTLTDCGIDPQEFDSRYRCYAENADSDCNYRFNNICDVERETCEADCFDCDPCQEHRFDGCEACVAAECVWCGADALCVSADALTTLGDAGGKLTCSSRDFVSTCPSDTGMDPIEEAMGWVFDAVNVRPVWANGYCKFISIPLELLPNLDLVRSW